MIDRFKTVFFTVGLAMAAFGMGSLAFTPQTEAMSRRGVQAQANRNTQQQWTNQYNRRVQQQNANRWKVYTDPRSTRLIEKAAAADRARQQKAQMDQMNARKKQQDDMYAAQRHNCTSQCQRQSSGTASDTFYYCSTRC